MSLPYIPCAYVKTLKENKIIDLSRFKCFCQPEIRMLCNLFHKYGHEIKVAGGAVRDIILGLEPKDIDFASTATPEEMRNIFDKENVRMLNRNGETHGTITARINDSANFEITTLRIDANPDGRHAEVVFTKDWMLDASRRDLTINSMFLEVEFDEDCSKLIKTDNFKCGTVTGRLFDFFGGEHDLINGIIRFVGDPVTRIQEDYLRILRYFRFHGRHAHGKKHDEKTLNAIADNAGGLEQITGERIWVEIKQIVLTRHAPDLFQSMAKCGVTHRCGLPQCPNIAEMHTVWDRGLLELAPNPATCIAAVLNGSDELETLINRVKPSNLETTILSFVVNHKLDVFPEDILKYFQRQYLLSVDFGHLRPVFDAMIQYLGQKKVLQAWYAWQPPRFPVNGHMIASSWNVKGRIMRPILNQLRILWVDSECQLSAEQLLNQDVRTDVMGYLADDLSMAETKKECRQHNIKYLKYGFIPSPANKLQQYVRFGKKCFPMNQ